MSERVRSPQRRARSAYAEALRVRGSSEYNLWLVRPPFAPPSPQLVLCSDIEYESYLYLEGEPRLTSIDYSPLRDTGVVPRRGSRLFAIGTTVGGSRVAVDLDPEGVGGWKDSSLTISLELLNQATSRTRSWRALLATINRCRGRELTPEILRCRRLIEAKTHVTVTDVLTRIDAEVPLVLGALATMLRHREICNDVDSTLWGPGTLLWRRDDD